MLRCPWCRRPIPITYHVAEMRLGQEAVELVGGWCAACGVFALRPRAGPALAQRPPDAVR